jgi:stress response protein YsnF
MYRSIVAAYSGLSDPSALRRELEAAGVPAHQIHISTDREARAEATTTATTESREPRGFLDWLFGVPENDMTYYRESLDAGHTIVKVHVAAAQAETVSQVLDRYEPIDVHSEREREVAATGAQRTTGPGVAASTAAVGTAPRAGTTSTREAIPVVEEDIKVGKREVDRGGVRVRSYVVEQPFEELVRLRDETIRVERRPASGTAPAGADAFKERSFEVRERDEEPVVQKTARVREEVVVSKEEGERTERVRDKTRRTQVDVEKEPETAGTGPGDTRPRRR